MHPIDDEVIIVTDSHLGSTCAPQPYNPVISNLITGKLLPGPIWHKRHYRLKFALRTLLFWSSTRTLLNTLAERADFSQLLRAQITLPSKTHRHYLTLGLTADQRADAIVSHYRFVDALPAPLAAALTGAAETPLLVMHGKDEAPFTLLASCARKAEREGECTLWLRDARQTLLASLTFSVTGDNQARQLIIGGLQGPRRNVDHDVIKQATRACYGLFPKRLLLEFVWQLAARTGINAVCGVSDSGHVFRALRYRLSKGRHFHASYDEFWRSIDGVQAGRYRWQLPLQLERKTLESIPSKKRAEYRRRFQLLDAMALQVASLTTPCAFR